MNEFLWQTYHRLISELEVIEHRFLYDQVDVTQRLTGIIGPRGVGKTTLLLQLIKEKLYKDNQAFYFSVDNTYFNEVSLLEYVNDLYLSHNIRHVFIDEVHKYKNWNQELKNIYDAFPKIKLIFSGSSSIDLIEGAYDLSRRARLLYLPGLSFREYLNIKTNQHFPSYDIEQIKTEHKKIAAEHAKTGNLLGHFSDYMAHGYYPFVFQNEKNIYETVDNIVNKTIYEDIANFFNLKTTNLNHLKRILNFLASMSPGEIKTNSLAQHLQIDNKTVDHYLEILRRTGMIKFLSASAHGNQTFTKPQKIYLDNTTLLVTITMFLSGAVDTGNQRELAFLQFALGAKLNVFYPKKGDFSIDNAVFEVGGKNKTWQQLKSFDGEKYLVKADILLGKTNEIPLYLFGFLY